MSILHPPPLSSHCLFHKFLASKSLQQVAAARGRSLTAQLGNSIESKRHWVEGIWRQRFGVRSCKSGGVVGDQSKKMDVGSDQKAVSESSTASITADLDRWKDAISRARFGKPIIIEPRAQHLATIVWLHGLGDNGYGWASTLETLPLPNVRWIVPTAPVRPVSVNGGFPCTAWFDVGSLTDDGPDDIKGLDLSAAFVASFLAREPPGIKLGVGGFSQGAATSLYTVTRSVGGKYSDGTPFPVKIDFAAGLSGWLPSSKFLKIQEAGNPEFARLAAEVPLYLAHGKRDYVVAFQFGEKSSQALQELGFTKIVFRPYKTLEHTTTEEELDELCDWLKKTLQL